MTAQVEFFCSPREERDVLRYLLKADGIQVFDVSSGTLKPWDTICPDELPAWSKPLAIRLWQPKMGMLKYHDSRPKMDTTTHGALVATILARDKWDAADLRPGVSMLNTNLSPTICYQRGLAKRRLRGPNLILAEPSSLDRVGSQYAKWVKRTLAWVRRRGKIVHDWRDQSNTIPNPHSLLNTMYALPDVQEQLNTTDHHFAILR